MRDPFFASRDALRGRGVQCIDAGLSIHRRENRYGQVLTDEQGNVFFTRMVLRFKEDAIDIPRVREQMVRYARYRQLLEQASRQSGIHLDESVILPDEELLVDAEAGITEERTSHLIGYQLESPFQYAFKQEDEAFDKGEVVNRYITAYGKAQASGGKKKSSGKFVLIVANGYPGYHSPDDEIKRIKAHLWFPHTKDFLATAQDTHNKELWRASTADEFFGALQSVKGKISRIAFLGHGNQSAGLGLSGDIVNYNFFGNTLDSNDLDRWQQGINTTIKQKLNDDAKIDLFACNEAVNKDFVKHMAKAFGVEVRAFDEKVMWCITFGEGKITSRGRIGAESAVKGIKSCLDKAWHKGVNDFVPPLPKGPP